MSNQIAVVSPFSMMAGRLNMDHDAVKSLMTNTLMKAKGNGTVTDEELMVFMSIANEYRLNPLSKEIYAFNNRGSIQPIVSIDGWLKIINGHKEFDGMEFEDHKDEKGNLDAITCRIYRKDRSRATEVTEYLGECQGSSEPWRKWPARMLRHKASIQAARYAFGLSGIIDPDEADRINSVSSSTKDITTSLPAYCDDSLATNLPKWEMAVGSSKTTPERIVSMIESKHTLSDAQRKTILNINAEPAIEAGQE